MIEILFGRCPAGERWGGKKGRYLWGAARRKRYRRAAFEPKQPVIVWIPMKVKACLTRPLGKR